MWDTAFATYGTYVETPLFQEPAHGTHRAQLHRETQPMRIRSALRDQVPIAIIEIEEPLHLGQHRLADEAPVRGDLLVAEELHRHESRP